ncbi:MAG TPA: hypothetical protein VHU84_11360 [Lacipirellulaceae bacterium]|nr:hypothetical protein [Lacipirellulaceae bacterium]
MTYQVARQPLLAAIILAGLAFALAAGCSHKKFDRPTGVTPQRMEVLAACYSMYLGKHQGHFPPEESTLKTFIRSDCKYILSKHGISDAGSIFVSDRDNKPLEVTYAKGAGTREFGPETIIAHEETGVAGKRLVALGSGVVREFDAATLDGIIHAER